VAFISWASDLVSGDTNGWGDVFVHDRGAITVPPAAAFTTDTTSGPAPLTVHFTDQSTGDITSWAWNFGDSGTSTAQNPSHRFLQNSTVTLTASGPGGQD
jgi:PKD repeat protein